MRKIIQRHTAEVLTQRFSPVVANGNHLESFTNYWYLGPTAGNSGLFGQAYFLSIRIFKMCPQSWEALSLTAGSDPCDEVFHHRNIFVPKQFLRFLVNLERIRPAHPPTLTFFLFLLHSHSALEYKFWS